MTKFELPLIMVNIDECQDIADGVDFTERIDAKIDAEARLRPLFELLTSFEAVVVKLHWGIGNGGNTLTFREIAKKRKVTYSQVQRAYTSAWQKFLKKGGD